MATRTPSLQARSQNHRDWGNFATANVLPNAPGAPLGNPGFAVLEAGDTAYVTGVGRYHCTAVGTAGGGDATWAQTGGGGGGFESEFVSGFVSSIGTAAARRGFTFGSDPITAAGSYTASALFQKIDSSFVSGTQQILGTLDGVGGWGIVDGSSGIGFQFVDSGGALRSNFVFEPGVVNQLVLFVLRVVNNGAGNSLTVQGFLNGAQRTEFFGATDGGAYTAGGNLCVGVKADGAVNPAANYRVSGVAYLDGTALSAAAIATHSRAVMEAGQMLDGVGYTDAWRVDDAGGNPGVVWTPFAGAGHLNTINAVALPRTVQPPPQVWL